VVFRAAVEGREVAERISYAGSLRLLWNIVAYSLEGALAALKGVERGHLERIKRFH